MKAAVRDKALCERLAARGAQALDDTELLSLLIGEAAPPYTARQTAEKLLSAAGGSLAALSRIPAARLRMYEGIGIGRASVLAAAFELGRRVSNRTAPEPVTVRSADDVARLMGPQLAELPHEELWAIYLSSAGGILEQRRVSQGGVAALLADCRIVVKRALELLASAMILVHNHPSGISLPSEEDKSLTRRISQAAALFDILLADHVIVSSGGHYSFRAAGLLD